MQFSKYNARLTRIENLIRHGNAGTPKQLAKRLEISERMVFRYLNELRLMGKPVTFCKLSGTYKFILD